MVKKQLEAFIYAMHTNNNEASAIHLDAHGKHGKPRSAQTNERTKRTNKQTHADNTHLMAMIINILNLLKLQFDVCVSRFIFMACRHLRM